ncbi:hypothetical protein [Anaeromicropila populeti]|uniref:Uncharacterized protein n=1 Tax=Anaeromicropila populeti TaxID=37658 RepID=A0A1I6J8U5_9FIRM|nr:hypothetical protein [Anaeromicropila populeti]SFR75331.1 hypothetical protein SAMN05661086_01459 [Anaeromicropila populeti]
MDDAIKKSLPQQGSQKSRDRSGLESDPGTKNTEFKKHWHQNIKKVD